MSAAAVCRDALREIIIIKKGDGKLGFIVNMFINYIEIYLLTSDAASFAHVHSVDITVFVYHCN